MTLVINIIPETIEGEDIKKVDCHVDGIDIGEYYSYPDTTSDATINTEVEADLTAKVYTWA